MYSSRRWLRILVCYRKQISCWLFAFSAVSYRLRVSIRCLIQSDNYRCRNRCCIIADCRICACCFFNRVGVSSGFRIADASKQNIRFTACRRISRYRLFAIYCVCRHRCIVLCCQYEAELTFSDCHRCSAVCIHIRLLYSKLCRSRIWLRVGICKRWTACCSSINLVAYGCLQLVICLFCNYYRYIYSLIRVGVTCFSIVYFLNGVFVGSFLVVTNLSEVYLAVCIIFDRLVCCERYTFRCRSILQYETELICTQCFSGQCLCDGKLCLRCFRCFVSISYRKHTFSFCVSSSGISDTWRILVCCFVQLNLYGRCNRPCVAGNTWIIHGKLCNRISVSSFCSIGDVPEVYKRTSVCCRRGLHRLLRSISCIGFCRHRCAVLCCQHESELILRDCLCNTVSACDVKIRLVYTKLCRSRIRLRVSICNRRIVCLCSILLIYYRGVKLIIRSRSYRHFRSYFFI